MEQALAEEKKREAAEKRARKEENQKKRQENERKNEVIQQVIPFCKNLGNRHLRARRVCGS